MFIPCHYKIYALCHKSYPRGRPEGYSIFEFSDFDNDEHNQTFMVMVTTYFIKHCIVFREQTIQLTLLQHKSHKDIESAANCLTFSVVLRRVHVHSTSDH